MKATILLGVILMATQAFALPKYQKQFGAAYPSFKKTSCSVCHLAEGNALNGYGNDLKAAGFDFKAIEPKDSDTDSFTNIEEIKAGSMPGDKDSTPSRP